MAEDVKDDNSFGGFIGALDAWKEEWQGMPEFPVGGVKHRKLMMFFQANVDVEAFSALIGQPIDERTKELQFPPASWRNATRRFHYVSDEALSPRYPIYIPSVGRWESHPTVTTLERMQVADYRVVVEPREYDAYANAIDEDKLLRLPENFSRRGAELTPARNWIWQHAIDQGHTRHWQLDDNIYGILRLMGSTRCHVHCSAPFLVVEDFVDRYSNVAIGGIAYRQNTYNPELTRLPYMLNRRAASIVLLDSTIPHRYQGHSYADTDLSLRVLKDKLCIVRINAFMADVAGLVARPDEEQLAAVEALCANHPDIVRCARRNKQWHPAIDYQAFVDNRLIAKQSDYAPEGVDEYGMVLVPLDEPFDDEDDDSALEDE